MATIHSVAEVAMTAKRKPWRPPAPLVLDGYRVHFTRRRYGGGVGGTTYTWAHVEIPGQSEPWGGPKLADLGDPWPCVRPANAELRHAITRALERAGVAL